MKLPSWNEFMKSVTAFESDVNIVINEFGEKLAKFKGEHTSLDRAIRTSIGFLPPPLNTIVGMIYDSAEGDERQKYQKAIEYLRKIQNQGEQHYNRIISKVDDIVAKVENIQTTSAKEESLNLIKDILTTGDNSIISKLDALTRKFHTIESISKKLDSVNSSLESIHDKLDAPMRGVKADPSVLATSSVDTADIPIMNRYMDSRLVQFSPSEKWFVESSIRKFNTLLADVKCPNFIEDLTVKSVAKLGIYYYDIDRTEEAMKMFDMILREYPDDLRSLNNKAASLHSTDKYKEALELLEKALKIYPDFFDAKLNKGAILIESGFPKEGLDILEPMLTERPHDTVVLRNLVLGYSKLGNLPRTKPYFDKAIELLPEDENLLNSMGVAYLRAGEPDQAIGYFDHVYRNNPSNHNSRINKSAALIEVGAYRLASDILVNVLKHEKNNYQAMSNLALAYYKQGQIDLAIVWGMRALESNPNDYETLNIVGNFYAGLGDYRKAIEYFDKALKIKPDYAFALANKSTDLLLLGEVREALQCMNEFLKYEPNDPTILHNRALALKRLLDEKSRQRFGDSQCFHEG